MTSTTHDDTFYPDPFQAGVSGVRSVSVLDMRSGDVWIWGRVDMRGRPSAAGPQRKGAGTGRDAGEGEISQHDSPNRQDSENRVRIEPPPPTPTRARLRGRNQTMSTSPPEKATKDHRRLHNCVPSVLVRLLVRDGVVL